VLRLLSAHGINHAEPIPNLKHGSVDSAELLPIEGQKDEFLTSGSDKQTPMIEPTHLARLILSRLSESEIGKLEGMHAEDMAVFLEALQNRFDAVMRNKRRAR
jgi:hypothetical protein